MFGLGGNRKLRKEIERLKLAVQHLEFNPATGLFENDNATYRGNTYPGDTAMIAAVNKAYNGCSDWGVNICKAVVEIRASMIGGAGIEVGVREGFTGDASKEIEFCKDLMMFNGLNADSQTSYAVEGGIEGRALFVMNSVIDGGKKKIRVRFVPYTSNGGASTYTIQTNPNDYTAITAVKITPQSGQAPYLLSPQYFAYRKFGGRASRVNQSSPLVGHVLPQIEAIDHALRDWREINNLYSKPTPVLELVNSSDAEPQYRLITQTLNWKIGQLLVVGGGVYKMVGPGMEGVQSILDEITVNLKITSGTTGIPPHFLGFPDLMANRATADSLTEVMFAATNKERSAWIQLYTEILRKSILLNNAIVGSAMDPSAIVALLPENAQTRLRQIVDIWLPVFSAKGITRKSFLDRIPGIDSEKEDEKVLKDIKAGAFDGIKPTDPGNGQLGTNKGGSSHSPGDTASLTRLEKRTTGAGRNAK